MADEDDTKLWVTLSVLTLVVTAGVFGYLYMTAEHTVAPAAHAPIEERAVSASHTPVTAHIVYDERYLHHDRS